MIRPVLAWQLSRRLAALDAELRRSLSPGRYAHSVRVARIAELLAWRYGVDPAVARFAGLAHDLAREMSARDLLDYALADGCHTEADELRKPVLAHGRAGAWLLRSRFGVTDDSVLDAVRHHTLGLAGMDKLAQIVFVADYLEPGRSFTTPAFRRQVRSLPLPEAVLACIRHNCERGKPAHPRTLELVRHLSKAGTPAIVESSGRKAEA